VRVMEAVEKVRLVVETVDVEGVVKVLVAVE
jgi:hypothetical protein